MRNSSKDTTGIASLDCHRYPLELKRAQIKHLPSFQEVRVRPSGLFPSVLDKLEGSFNAGIFAWTRALFIKSFTSSCLDLLPI